MVPVIFDDTGSQDTRLWTSGPSSVRTLPDFPCSVSPLLDRVFERSTLSDHVTRSLSVVVPRVFPSVDPPVRCVPERLTDPNEIPVSPSKTSTA